MIDKKLYFKMPNGDTITSDDEWDGNTIKRIRQGWRMTQTTFAELLGVTQNTVSNWENGLYKPMARQFQKIFNKFMLPCYFIKK